MLNVDVNIGSAKVSMLATAIFDHLFINSYISAMDRLVVIKFQTNIANKWLSMIQRKILAIIFLFIKLF